MPLKTRLSPHTSSSLISLSTNPPYPHSNAHERALIVNLETDVSEIQAKVHVTKTANRVLEHELAATEGRCERVAGTVESSPSARLKHVHRVEGKPLCLVDELMVSK